MKGIRAGLLDCALAAFAAAGMMTAGVPAAPPMEDLQALVKMLPEFKIENATVESGLRKLWADAVGHPPKNLAFRYSNPLSEPAPVIRLNLKNVEVRQVVEYIASIAGGRWRILGPDSDALTLEVSRIVVLDDTELYLFPQVSISPLVRRQDWACGKGWTHPELFQP